MCFTAHCSVLHTDAYLLSDCSNIRSFVSISEAYQTRTRLRYTIITIQSLAIATAHCRNNIYIKLAHLLFVNEAIWLRKYSAE